MKFYGKIGFSYEVEVRPGITLPRTEEHEAYGDVLSNVRRWETDADINDDITTSNRISILADRFVCEHMGAMRYCKWNGTTWAIRSVELIRPRAILTLGGVYNGESENSEEAGPGEDEEGTTEESQD